jgi:hypothetical protein
MRLTGAQDEHARLVGVVAASASGKGSEALAESRLGASRAYVASREQWLHWIDQGESLEPWADGEWAHVGAYAREREHEGAELARATRALRRELARRRLIWIRRKRILSSRPRTRIRRCPIWNRGTQIGISTRRIAPS